MLDRDLGIKELATEIFRAEHVCSRNPFELAPDLLAQQGNHLLQLFELDQAPISGSNGSRIARRIDLVAAQSEHTVGDLAVHTSVENWIDHDESLQHALKKLADHGWLFVRTNGALVGTIGNQDLGRPIVSAYLLAVILGLERGMRRLYGSYEGHPIPDEPYALNADQQQAGIRPDNFTTTIKYVCSCKQLLEDLEFSSTNKADRALQRINRMRNDLAHARTALNSGKDLAEVLQRIKALEALATRVQQLLVDREAVWSAYANTMILSADQSEVIFAGSGANSLPINTPAHVISAQNPYEQFLGPDENTRRTEILGEFLNVNPSVTALARVLGRSADPDATWAEESWAVSGLKRAEALEIGSIFQQRAIFELTDNEIITIAIDGTVMHVNPRCLA